MNRMKDTSGQLYGNSATAARTAKQAQMDAIVDVAAGLLTLNPGRSLRGVGDVFSGTLRERRADAVNNVLSETNLPDVYRLLSKLRESQRSSQLPGRFDLPDELRRLPASMQRRVETVMDNQVRGNDLVPFVAAAEAPFVRSNSDKRR
jgi:hypothetical protein